MHVQNFWNKKFTKKLNKIVPCKRFEIFKEHGRNDTFPDKYKKEWNWIPDINDYILKLFFPAEALYGSVAVIRPDGTFMAYLGEYEEERVFEMVEKLKE